ncbi:MAG: response regulator, partial [Clostridiales bacterium]|nr:response regulator [Clostridiales bacterium]
KEVRQENENKRDRKILLVEDMLANQKLGLAMLKNFGYEADLAANGKLAADMCDNMVYDLILMDCQMPVMDGYEATSLIKNSSRFNRETPVIAMTANAMEGDREKCISAGMDDYISKPIKLSALKVILESFLR